jgi:DNA-binding LacI/PurR family transcriptional regulator
MATTLKQIAEHCGLSVQTVGYVINNKGHLFRPETRDKVLKAARELGYRPNGAAKAMRSGRFGCAALVLSTQEGHSSVFTPLLDGIDGELAKHNMHLVHAPLPDEQLTSDGFVPKILSQWMADGLLINYNAAIPARMIEVIEGHNIPSVWMNSKQKHDCVYPDDFGGGVLATEHLLALGHTRIAFVDYSHGQEVPPKHYSAVDRPGGYAQAMKAAGLEPRLICASGWLTPRERIAFTLDWLRADDRPTAVITYSSFEALPIYHAATAVLGMRLPQALSLATFADFPVDDLGVSIATVVIPRAELGRTAVRMLLQKIEAPARDLAPLALPLSFQPGETCAPPGG